MVVSNLSERWEKFAALATLGTSRAALSAEVWSGLPATLASPSAADTTQLLRAAAAVYLMELASNRTAKTDLALPESDAAETQSFATENACWRLARLLTGDMRGLLSEWCTLAMGAKRVVPPHWLPAILQTVKGEELAELQSILGVRAIWLSHQGLSRQGAQSNPTPQVAAIDSNAAWQTGTLAEREALLKKLREEQPREARELIESTWATDPPEARATFLELCKINASVEDEALLERALDDKRKTVRTAAAECLLIIKESAHQKRMAARVDPLLTFDANAKGGIFGMQRRAQLTVSLPDALPVDAIRDGIDQKVPAQRKLGERSFWLLQMLSAVDPSHWSDRFAVPPDKLLAAMLACEESSLVIEGIVVATQRHANAQWARTLCEWWADENADEKFRALAPLIHLLNALEGPSRQNIVLSLLDKLGPRNWELICSLLGAAEGQWSKDLTAAASAVLLKQIKSEQRAWTYPRELLADWGMRVDIPTVAKIQNDLESAGAGSQAWGNALQRFLEIVEFRKAMHADFSST